MSGDEKSGALFDVQEVPPNVYCPFCMIRFYWLEAKGVTVQVDAAVVCEQCAGVGFFNHDSTIRKPTPEDELMLVMNPELKKAIKRVCMSVKYKLMVARAPWN